MLIKERPQNRLNEHKNPIQLFIMCLLDTNFLYVALAVLKLGK